MFNSNNGASMSPADFAAMLGSNGVNSLGGEGGLLILIILFALFGWGGNGGNRGGSNPAYIGGAGGVGGNELYPWLNNSQQMAQGFADQATATTLSGISQGINGIAPQLCNGFNGELP